MNESATDKLEAPLSDLDQLTRVIADNASDAIITIDELSTIVVDIDHSPRHFLCEQNAAFYEVDGLRRLAEQLHPGGVFALWSDDPPDARDPRA